MRGEKEIGLIKKTSWWRNNASIDLPAEWPLALKVFVFYVVAIFWRNQQAAS